MFGTIISTTLIVLAVYYILILVTGWISWRLAVRRALRKKMTPTERERLPISLQQEVKQYEPEIALSGFKPFVCLDSGHLLSAVFLNENRSAALSFTLCAPAPLGWLVSLLALNFKGVAPGKVKRSIESLTRDGVWLVTSDLDPIPFPPFVSATFLPPPTKLSELVQSHYDSVVQKIGSSGASVLSIDSVEQYISLSHDLTSRLHNYDRDQGGYLALLRRILRFQRKGP